MTIVLLLSCSQPAPKPVESATLFPVVDTDTGEPAEDEGECPPEERAPTGADPICVEREPGPVCEGACANSDTHGSSVRNVFLPGHMADVDFPSWPVEGQDTANPNLTRTCVAAETVDAGCRRLLGTTECPHAASDVYDDPDWGADGNGWTYFGEIPAPSGEPLHMMFATYEFNEFAQSYLWVYYDSTGDVVLLKAYRDRYWCCNGLGGGWNAFWGDLPAYGMCDPA